MPSPVALSSFPPDPVRSGSVNAGSQKSMETDKPRFPVPKSRQPSSAASAANGASAVRGNAERAIKEAPKESLLYSFSGLFLGKSEDELGAADIGMGKGIALFAAGILTFSSRVLAAVGGLLMAIPAALAIAVYKTIDVLFWVATFTTFELERVIFDKDYKPFSGMKHVDSDQLYPDGETDVKKIWKTITGGGAAIVAAIPAGIGALITSAVVDKSADAADDFQEEMIQQNMKIGCAFANKLPEIWACIRCLMIIFGKG